MADPTDKGGLTDRADQDGPPKATLSRTKPRRPVAWWVLVTFVFLTVLQAGLPLYIVTTQNLWDGFDWAGFIGYTLGSIAVPMAVGCLGLLFRRRPGLAYFLVSVAVFVFATLGSAVTT